MNGWSRALILVLVLVVGAGTGPAAARAEVLNLFVGTNPHFSIVFVAEKLELFRKHGVDVKVTGFASGTAASEAFRAGRGEVVGAGDLPSIRLWQRGEGVGIAPFTNVCKMQLVVGRAGVNGAADLKGRTIGTVVGSTSEFFLQKYLATAKLDWSDVKVKNLAPADLVVAVVRGDIDAFVWAEPWGMQAVQASQGAAKILTYGCGYFTEYMVLNASPPAARTRSADLVKMLAALREAGEYIAKNPEPSARIVADRLKLDVALVRELLPRFTWSLSNTRTFRADMDALAQFMVERKALKQGIDWRTMLDSRFLRELDPALVED